jgi:hypothetical protein
MTAKRWKRGILPVLSGLVLALFPAPASSRASGPQSPLPGEILGWKAAGPGRVFDRTTLGRYMTGGEDLYLAYDFRKLTSRDYVKPAGPRVTAEIFEMGSPEEAFGLFTNEREASPAEVGNAGLSGIRYLQFWKGPMFVRVLSEREMPESRKALTALAQAIAAALPPGGRKPLVVSCLPTQDLVPGRLSFFHLRSTLERLRFPGDASALILDAKTDAVLAQYRREGQTLEAIVCIYPTDDQAGRALASVLEAYFGVKSGKPGEVVAKKISSGRFASVRLTGRALILVFNAPDKGAAGALSDQIHARTKEVLGS